MNSRIIITLCVAWIISIVTVNAQKRNMEMKQLFPVGNKLSPDAARNFKGQAYLDPLTTLKELNVPDKLGGENWRVRLQMGRKFVETINKYGGDATLVELPKIGIYGNTHFLMSDLNNAGDCRLVG